MTTHNHESVQPLQETGDYLCLVVDDDEYGVRTSLVNSVMAAPAIRRVPRAPDFIRGVANIKGRIVPILDVGKRFGTADPEISGPETSEKKQQLVILKEGSGLYGLLINSVEPVVRLLETDIEPVNPLLCRPDAPFISAMAKLDNRLIQLLDVSAFLYTGVATSLEKKKVFAAYNARIQEQEKLSDTRKNFRRILLMSIGEEEYGVEVKSLQRIVPATALKESEGGPGYLAGILASGKSFLPIIDLQKKLDLDPLAYTQNAMVAVLAAGSVRFGVLVNAITSIINIDETLIRDSPVILSDDDSRHINGVAMLDSGQRLIMLLDENGILDQKELDELKQMKSITVSPSRRKMKKEKNRGFMTFTVAGVSCALAVENLFCVIEYIKPKKVPKAPSFVRGIVPVEGELVSVIDLKKRFNLETELPTAEEWIIIVKTKDNSLQGIIADSVAKIQPVADHEIAPLPEISTSIGADFIDGIIVSEKDSELAPIILNLTRITSA